LNSDNDNLQTQSINSPAQLIDYKGRVMLLEKEIKAERTKSSAITMELKTASHQVNDLLSKYCKVENIALHMINKMPVSSSPLASPSKCKSPRKGDLKEALIICKDRLKELENYVTRLKHLSIEQNKSQSSLSPMNEKRDKRSGKIEEEIGTRSKQLGSNEESDTIKMMIRVEKVLAKTYTELEYDMNRESASEIMDKISKELQDAKEERKYFREKAEFWEENAKDLQLFIQEASSTNNSLLGLLSKSPGKASINNNLVKE